MTKERKASANWYIAATHYLTAGLVVPFLGNLVIAFVLVPIFGVGTFATMGLSAVVLVGAIWLGVIYSARFLERTYIISDPRKITSFSTTYYVVLNVLYIIAITFASSDIGDRLVSIVFSGVILVIGTATFYFASTKYVKVTVANPTPSAVQAS